MQHRGWWGGSNGDGGGFLLPSPLPPLSLPSSPMYQINTEDIFHDPRFYVLGMLALFGAFGAWAFLKKR